MAIHGSCNFCHAITHEWTVIARKKGYFQTVFHFYDTMTRTNDRTNKSITNGFIPLKQVNRLCLRSMSFHMTTIPLDTKFGSCDHSCNWAKPYTKVEQVRHAWVSQIQPLFPRASNFDSNELVTREYTPIANLPYTNGLNKSLITSKIKHLKKCILFSGTPCIAYRCQVLSNPEEQNL